MILKKTQHHSGEDGMALLLVLAVLAATTILAAHMMLVSETVAKDAKVAALTDELRLQAESAADMGLWMHLTDRRLFSDRTLGVDLADRDATSDFEPWMMDRREHLLYDDSCQVFIGDAMKSISVSNLESAIKNGIDDDDTDSLDAANEFIDIYKDYTDNNDLINLYGKEADDYANEGYGTLPRNNPMQFRAEIYWLENWRNVINGEVTIIPPPGISFESESSSNSRNSRQGRTTSNSSSANTRIPFFTASSQDFINQLTDLSDADLQAILDAREAWTLNAIPLEESLDADLLYNVKSKFSFSESNYAEITTTATDPSGEIRVIRTVTREVNMSSNSIFADRAKETLSIWEIRRE